MCGIFGHYIFGTEYSRRRIIELLLSGLHRLEYRGYDSAGFAIESDPLSLSRSGSLVQQAGASCQASPPIIVKSQGNIDALEELAWADLERRKVDFQQSFHNHVGIAHTRWATHGEPSARNAHPITSGPKADFMVVHNGIITNFAKLRKFLVDEGHEFHSDTDTEVIPKLCAYLYDNQDGPVVFSELVMEVLRRLEGAYAILVTSTHFPGELVCCRRGSPVVFGLKNYGGAAKQRFRRMTDLSGDCFGEHVLECFIASDDKAIIEHTREAIPLEDGDVVHIKGAGWGIFNIDSDELEISVPRALLKLEGKLEGVIKGDFEHFMQKEIFEQPESLRSTMLGRVKRVLNSGDPYLHPRITLGGLEDYVPLIRRSRRILLVACGTSYHACLASRPLLESLCELPVSLELASDMMDRRCPVFRDDTIVFLSQSGETADTLAALRYAKAAGALCVGVTNTVGSGISRETECGVHLNAGYEMGVASTKAYTSQVVVLTMIALLLARDSISKRELHDEIADALLRVPDAVQEVLKLDERVSALAKQLADKASILFFGRGHNYATALEAALKVKELALIHSEGILAGELKHGPLALIDQHLPVVVIATQDAMYRKMVSVILQLKARNAWLIVICNEGDQEVQDIVDAPISHAGEEPAPRGQVIFVPKTVEAVQPVVNIVPLQLLSYHLTLLRGHSVDQPRNLAKSVTVTEED